MKIKSSLLRSSFSGAASSVIFAMVLGVALVVPTRGGGNVVNATGGESGVFDAENSDNNNSNDDPDDSFGGFGETDFEVSPEDQASGIDPQAAGATLTIGTPSLSGSAEPGGTAYARSKVTYTATDIASWALKVSYASGSSALKYEGTSGTTIGGAADKAYSSMADNTWGYAWTDTDANAASSQVYKTMPAYGSPATMKSGTAAVSSATGSVHFAAKFGAAATPGHYKTNVLLSLVATPKSVNYSLTYNANNGTGAPAAQTYSGSDSSYTFTLSSTKPTRTNYTFLGWADSASATTAAYQPGGTITLQSTSPTKTIYAVWKAADTLTAISKMQDMTSSVCANSAIGAKATLTDSRDNSTYTVEKLKDGKCWMTQNLRLINKAITSADSDVSANFTVPSSALWTDTSYTAPHAYYNNNTTYGAYYNWYTATAGTGTNSVSSGDASSSICPKGWRLPKGTPGTGTNEFAVVAGLTSTNVAANTSYWSSLSSPSFANNALTVNGVTFPAAGYVSTSNGSLYNAGSYGYYWSSTANNSDRAYSLFFYSGRFSPANDYSYKYAGLSVRCVAR